MREEGVEVGAGQGRPETERGGVRTVAFIYIFTVTPLRVEGARVGIPAASAHAYASCKLPVNHMTINTTAMRDWGGGGGGRAR